MKKIIFISILFLTSCVQIGYIEKINRNYSDSTKYYNVFINIPSKNKRIIIDDCKHKIKGVDVKEKCTVKVRFGKIIKVYEIKKEN